MIKTKENQNTIVYKTRIIGKDKKSGRPIFQKLKIVTTMGRLTIRDANTDELIGESGVVRNEDFDFDTLYALALHKSGSKIEVA